MKRRRPSSRARLNPDRVWELLNRRNLTQNELARLAGVSSGYLSQMMTGVRCPSPPTRRRFLEALELESFDDLFILEPQS